MFRGGTDPKRGPNWRRLAAAIRQRDDYTCRRCGKSQAENGQRLAVDHIMPWRLFDDADKTAANDPNNLVSLCKSCHAWKTARAERKFLRGDVIDFREYEKAIRSLSAARM
jgi:5-methylcytosine-specific restriction endonuclease McrA